MSRIRCLLAVVASTAALLALPALARAAVFTNGDFETGTLSGWTHVDAPDSGAGSWFAYTGTTTPLFHDPVSAPPQGSFAAVTDQGGPGSRILYQDLTLPAASDLQLSLFVYYRSDAPIDSPDTLDFNTFPNQQYRVDLMKPGAPTDSVAPGDVLLTVFRTSTGDSQTLAPTVKTVNLSAFAGQTVRLRLAEVDNQGPFNASADAVTTNAFEVGKASYNKKKGTATVPVSLPNAGDLAATGKGVKVKVGASTAAPVSGGTAKLKVKPKAKVRRKLNATGKAKVKLKISFTPSGLGAVTQKTKLKLREKKG